MIELYKDYNNLCRTIEWLEAQLEVSEAERQRWMSGDLGNNHKYMTRLTNMDRLAKNIAQYEEQLTMYRQQKEKIDACISGLKGTEHQIAKLKYIDGKTLSEIADELFLNYDYVRRVHAKMTKVTLKSHTV